MENRMIAKMVSEGCWRSNKSTQEFAFQLFVEEVVVPKSVESYTEEELFNYLLDFLNKDK